MAFDLKSFAAQVRPSVRTAEPFDGSVLDAGSPQYVRPEDLFLDIQGRLFEVKRLGAKDLGGIEPANFEKRWRAVAAPKAGFRKIGAVSDGDLASAVMSLLRCPKRKNEKFRTMLPLVPSLSFYKNIKPNLPNFLGDQFRPALTFADESLYARRVAEFKQALHPGTQANDPMKQLATGFLPNEQGRPFVEGAGNIEAHVGPMLKNFSVSPSRPLDVSATFAATIEALLILEQKIPRVLWTRWVTASMRLWLPLFFLRRCAVTISAAHSSKNLLASGRAPTPDELTKQLLRPQALLRGSKEWLGQLAPLVQSYVRARFELCILLDLSNLVEHLRLQKVDPLVAAHGARARQLLDEYEIDRTQVTTPLPLAVGEFLNPDPKSPGPRRISMPNDDGNDRLSLSKWFDWMVVNRRRLDGLATLIGAADALDLVERVYAYVRPEYEPLRTGFGKNALEYVAFTLGAPRKADRDPEFPDEFSLLYRGEGGRRARQVQISSGPQLLGFLVQLVAFQTSSRRMSAKLSDLLDTFESLGVDYRSNPEDFEVLKADLLRLGLLKSSADAAEAASLNASYSL